MRNKHLFCLFFMVWLILPMVTIQAQPAAPPHLPYSERFNNGRLGDWNSYGVTAVVSTLNKDSALQTQGDCQVFWGAVDDTTRMYRDITVEGDVSVERNNVNSGFIVRASKQVGSNQWSGYWASIRKVDVGYAVVQLYRFPDYVLLQEARVQGAVSDNQRVHLKVTCQGPNLWVWTNDVRVPAITESDDRCTAPGFIGLKAENNKAYFTNIVVSKVGKTPPAPYVHDWSRIKGAVFITSGSVNSCQMWEEYHPESIERELSYAQASGLNTVQVYLNFLVWQKYRQVYLAHIEDFLTRASRHGLKVTFIFFDDVGNIEPPHLAPYSEPVPGIHNSQMQGCPGREIVDHQYATYRRRLKEYVQAVVGAYKNDSRILFWQTYNEPSHATTLPLLADAYAWIKEVGSTLPVSATGGGAFYGSYYSDFPTFHSYLDPHAAPSQKMALGDGGSEHLCTETLDRPGVDVPKLVSYFAERKTGWILWELMIGKDNCRFPWGSPLGAAEPTTPFHGLLYPDGRPWSAEDIKLIRGGSKSFQILAPRPKSHAPRTTF